MRAVLVIAILAVLAAPVFAASTCGGATCTSPSTQECKTVTRVLTSGGSSTSSCTCCATNLTSYTSTSRIDCPSGCCNWYTREGNSNTFYVGMCDSSYYMDIQATYISASSGISFSCYDYDWSTTSYPARIGYFYCGSISYSCNTESRTISAGVYYNSSYTYTLFTSKSFTIQGSNYGCALAAAVGLAFGIIIAIVIGILVAIIACIVCCVCCICKKAPPPQTIIIQQQPGMGMGQPMNV